MSSFIEHFNRRRIEFWQTEAAKRRAQDAARTSPRNPVASNVNYDCQREMYHAIVNWDARPDPAPAVQELMRNGNVASKAARLLLEEMGYTLIETEGPIEPFRNKAGRIVYTGRIDYILVLDGQKIPLEAKDVDSFMFERLSTYEDLEHYRWTRKWRGQILLYLLQKNQPEGAVLLHSRGRLKLIPVILEERLQDAERALQIGEEVEAAVRAKTPPPFTKDPTICRGCWAFGRVCNPPIEEQGAAVLEPDGELYEVLTVRAETEEAHRRYEAADKRSKEIVKAAKVERAICGEYAITVSERQVKAETKLRPARIDKIVKIVRAGAAAADQEVA